MKVFIYTAPALAAFALNSVLCRLALGSEAIDPAGFTLIRLLSGAVALYLIVRVSRKPKAEKTPGSWVSAFLLFAYAICFSFAYTSLTAATGALILFGSVQLTMISSAIIKGERPRLLEWAGLLLALGGLVYLVFPKIESPSPLHFSLMAIAGISWGFYTLRGRGSLDPLRETSAIFLRSLPIIAIAVLPFIYQMRVSPIGILFAILSGAFASGIGYAIWYSALKYHTAARSAVLQLSVPVLAAIGGILFLAESFTLHLLASGGLILGGIGLTLASRAKQ